MTIQPFNFHSAVRIIVELSLFVQAFNNRHFIWLHCLEIYRNLNLKYCKISDRDQGYRVIELDCILSYYL